MLHDVTKSPQLPFGGYSGISHCTCMSLLPNNNGNSINSKNSNSSSQKQQQHGVFALGSRCGRVALFDTATMQQQELITLSPTAASVGNTAATAAAAAAWKRSSVAASSTAGAAGAPGSPGRYTYTSAAGSAVCSLRSAARGSLLLAAQESGEISVIAVGGSSSISTSSGGNVGATSNYGSSQLASIFSPSVVSRLPVPLYQAGGAAQVQISADRMHNPHQHSAVLVSCVGEARDRLLGVVRRHSNVLELYFKHDGASGAPSHSSSSSSLLLHNYLNVSLKTPPDLESNHEGENSAYFGTEAHSSQAANNASSISTSETGCNIAITACHVIVSDRTYIISIIGRMVPPALNTGSSGSSGSGGEYQSYSAEQLAAAPVYLFSGSVTLPDEPAVTAQAVLTYTRGASNAPLYHDGIGSTAAVTGSDGAAVAATSAAIDVTPYLVMLRQRILVDDQPTLSATTSTSSSASTSHAAAAVESALRVQNSVSFCGRHCAVVTVDAVNVIDLLKVRLKFNQNIQLSFIDILSYFIYTTHRSTRVLRAAR